MDNNWSMKLQGFNNLNLRKLNPNQQLYHHFSFDPIYLQENKNDVYVNFFNAKLIALICSSVCNANTQRECLCFK